MARHPDGLPSRHDVLAACLPYGRAFCDAMTELLNDEGEYSNDPRDPGGETVWGICKRSHPDLFRPLPEAKDIAERYHSIYWRQAGCDRVPEELAPRLFSAAVNVGAPVAVQFLQRACNTLQYVAKLQVDGKFGPFTAHAVNQCHGKYAAALLTAWRFHWTDYYLGLRKPAFIRGWLGRVR